MRETICSQETVVARAARTGLWDSTVREHADACAVCQELVLGITAMQSLVAGVERESELPGAGWLWRKALLEQKQADTDRVQRPLRLAQYTAGLTGILALAACAGWYWRPLEVQFAVWQVELLPRLWQGFWSLAGTSLPTSRGPLLLVLLLAIAVLLAYPVLVEE
jgi:hypothetical protein